jgi:hypothetical protein
MHSIVITEPVFTKLMLRVSVALCLATDTKKASAYDGLVIISHVGVGKNLIFLPMYYMNVML